MEGVLAKLADRLRGSSRLDDELGRRYAADRGAVLGHRLNDLSAAQLEGIRARLLSDGETLVAAQVALRERSDQALAEHDWRRVQECRKRTIDLGREFDELQILRRKVADALSERLLSDALAQRLGSHTRRRIYDGVIMTLIVVVISILLYQETHALSPETIIALDYVDIGACAVFLFDFFWRLRLADDKRWFLRRYWVDFLTSIPLPSVYTLRLGRSLRLLRFVRLLRVARLARFVRVFLFFWRGMDKLTAAFDVRILRRSVSILVVVLVIGGLGIYMAEGDDSARGVETFGQSLWWSFTTVVTGGFADIRNPNTITGRLLTALLIVAGMVVVGIFTATLTSLLVREGDVSGEILALEERLLSELRALREELLLGAPQGAPQGPNADDGGPPGLGSPPEKTDEEAT